VVFGAIINPALIQSGAFRPLAAAIAQKYRTAGEEIITSPPG